MSAPINTISKSDTVLQREVLEELNWEPSIDAAEIGVIVQEGIVTLTGTVRNYYQKQAAERAAARVDGVRAIVVEGLQVKLHPSYELADVDIAKAAYLVLYQHVAALRDVKATVEHGLVTLTGEVEWYYQKQLAQDAIAGLRGVTGISNNITIKPNQQSVTVKENIERAIQRQIFGWQNVQVEVQDGTVILRGTVPTWIDRYKAQTAAWASPGVANVENQLRIAG